MRKLALPAALAATLVASSAAAKFSNPLDELVSTVFAPLMPPVRVAALHSPSRAGFHRLNGRRTDTWRMTPFLRAIPGAGFVGRAMRASFYGAGERLNKRTANGEVFNPRAMTAAHRTLPFGTRLQVCYRGCTVVRINDRGPAAWTGRSLDLTAGAARAINHPGDAFVQAVVVR
jgi:hypothetical protein